MTYQDLEIDDRPEDCCPTAGRLRPITAMAAEEQEAFFGGGFGSVYAAMAGRHSSFSLHLFCCYTVQSETNNKTPTCITHAGLRASLDLTAKPLDTRHTNDDIRQHKVVIS